MSEQALPVAVRKKQLGQYFTPQRVGRLLAALAGATSATSIIDPMVGSADLLLSCLAVGAKPNRLVGIDLDPLAIAQAKLALIDSPMFEPIEGDAFSAELPPEQFDLVITNPPYIRYQSRGEIDGISIPSADRVREGLIQAINHRHGLTTEDRECFLRAAQSYPGTSDIAVPAWILSASLVRDGGMLAVVVPQTWLSRNYAHTVRQLLDDAFEIEVILEDDDAIWFDDAQVRTQLVLARRRPTAKGATGHSVVAARATAALEIEGSLRGSFGSEKELSVAVRKVTSTRPIALTTGLTAHREKGLYVATTGRDNEIPRRVAAVIGAAASSLVTRTLESYGWRAGQGLRSGANDFFYVTERDGLTCPAARWEVGALDLPAQSLLPAVRRQSDLGNNLSVTEDMLTARLVNLRGWATAADARKMVNPDDVRILPAGVARWIDQVAKTPATVSTPGKKFPELTAVAPNIKSNSQGRPAQFWYQLPELAARHRPAVFMGRVCGGKPAAYLNPYRYVVDANFASLWPTDPDAISADALLALLNSSWTWANLEVTCTVLGGGALKVEATDLRRLRLPNLSSAQVERLSELGRRAASAWTPDLLSAIDSIVAEAIAGDSGSIFSLRSFAEKALESRSRKL